MAKQDDLKDLISEGPVTASENEAESLMGSTSLPTSKISNVASKKSAHVSEEQIELEKPVKDVSQLESQMDTDVRN